MKALQNHNGFTFIEIVLALFIMGALLNAMLLLQGTIFRSIGTFSNSLQRIFLLKKRLSDASYSYLQRTEPVIGKPDKKEIEQPPTTITYELKKPSSKSSLHDFKGILIEQAKAEWKEFGMNRDETLITLRYQPPKKES